ncbi:MAG TPA: hypothetical protein VFA57_07370 [Pseudolabrys sp.]|nr:hypothetical protein [Pseudolabrys sp.]
MNVASFQEMPDVAVDAYFSDIDRVTSGAFYILQSALPNTKDGMTGAYPVRATWKEAFRRPCRHLPDYFEAMYLTR